MSEAETPGLILQNSPRLEEKLTDADRRKSPIHVSGQGIKARPDLDLLIQGEALIRKQGLVIRSDRIEYDQANDTLNAEGHVRIKREGNLFEGPSLNLHLDTFQGKFLQPQFQLLKGGGHGSASEIEFMDAQRAVIRNATSTTCSRVPGPSWLPEWILKAASFPRLATFLLFSLIP